MTMSFKKEQIATFLIAAVIFAGIGLLAWTQRPGAGGGDDVQAGRNEATQSLEIGMIDSHRPSPGEPAPDFVLADADGNKIRLSDFRGTPIFLNFWATWCPFCIEEMPDMEAVHQQFGDNLVVLGINNGEPASVGEPFATERVGVTYRLVYDADEEIVNGYNIRAMPTSYFIDADGIIREFQFGFLTLEQMVEKVESTLAEARLAP